ncbi:MAG TPA: hypothetical protein DCL99_05410 [Firmicutes bacterium]|nr:hypothetical protein [Bacillota bacterium]
MVYISSSPQEKGAQVTKFQLPPGAKLESPLRAVLPHHTEAQVCGIQLVVKGKVKALGKPVGG